VNKNVAPGYSYTQVFKTTNQMAEHGTMKRNVSMQTDSANNAMKPDHSLTTDSTFLRMTSSIIPFLIMERHVA
jgi:hypothetical protein